MDEFRLVFKSPFGMNDLAPISLVELRMRWFSSKVRCKPEWWRKVHDDEIVAKWRREMVEHDAVMVDKFWGGEKYYDSGHGEKQWPREKLTDVQLDYIFDELRYEAGRYDEQTGIFVSMVVCSHEGR